MSHLADQVGRVLGERYRLVAPIGTGGSAHVFAADDVKLRRRVAVKILHPALARDESFLRRFRAEAQAVANLRHPNIMTVFDWGEDTDGPYLVLEHLGGGSLRDLLDNGHRLSPAQARTMGLEAARGLDYAHRREVVHRDIKPANLLFDEDGRLGIADFGLARALAGASVTEPGGALLGTIRYFAPEQAQGGSVDGKSDVYALALVLVEAVTGQAPPVGDNIAATVAARIGRPIEVPESLGPLVAVLEAAGAADPAERLDAGGLVRALEAAGRDLPHPEPLPVAVLPAALSPAVPDDLTQLPPARPRLFDVEAEAGDSQPEPFPVLRRGRGRKVLVALGVMIAALAVTGGAYAFVQSRVPRHPVPQVVAMTLDAARAEVADEDFSIVVSDRRFDEEVEADRIISQNQPVGKALKEGTTVRVVVSKGAEPREVPSLAGLTRAAAEAALTGAKFAPVFKAEYHESIEKDVVIGWSPREGPQPRGSEVTVTVSEGKKPVKVPSLAEKVYDEARKVLEGLGLVARQEDAFSDDVAKGSVISTRPPGGEEAPFGSEVVVKVSKGPDLVAVPSVIGKDFDQAKQALEAAGLRVDGPFPPKKGRVFLTDPAPGANVRRGTTVNVFVK